MYGAGCGNLTHLYDLEDRGTYPIPNLHNTNIQQKINNVNTLTMINMHMNQHKHKFLISCSCLICGKATTVQSLEKHISAHINSNVVKSMCVHCQSPIYQYGKKFCNKSCAASHNNKSKVRSIESVTKTSESMKIVAASRKKAPPIEATCLICNTLFVKKPHSKTKLCSKRCVHAHISNVMKEKVKNGYNPNKHRGRHKRSYMETSFETWLNEVFPSISYDAEHPFRSTDLNKTFFTDFYFEDLKLAIELDGTQHKHTIEYDSIRDANILLEHGVYVYRISHKEYKSGIKIEQVKLILSM